MPSTINLYQIGVWFCVGLGNCCSLNCRREHYRTLSHRLPGAAVGDVAACASLGMASRSCARDLRCTAYSSQCQPIAGSLKMNVLARFC
jgi:hypothetical protein